MRLRCGLALVGVLALAGCGDDGDRVNRDRPPVTIDVTAAIAGGAIHVSPRRFGGGPIRLLVSNQTGREQALTLETAGDASGVTGTTGPIRAAGTGQLQMDVPEGDYEISARDKAIRPTAVTVGAQRRSAQNDLLLP
jgi:hypothetical protein